MNKIYTLIVLIAAVTMLSCIVGCDYKNVYQTRLDNSIAKYTEKWRPIFPGLRLFNADNTTDNTNVLYGFMMLGSDKVTLRQARFMGATIAEDFWKNIQKSKEVDAYIEDQIKKDKNLRRSKYVPEPRGPFLNEVAFRIDYWNNKVERPTAPYIAQIIFNNEKLSYYYAEPTTEELYLAYEESYEDAIAYKNKMQTMPDQKT